MWQQFSLFIAQGKPIKVNKCYILYNFLEQMQHNFKKYMTSLTSFWQNVVVFHSWHEIMKNIVIYGRIPAILVIFSIFWYANLVRKQLIPHCGLKFEKKVWLKLTWVDSSWLNLNGHKWVLELIGISTWLKWIHEWILNRNFSGTLCISKDFLKGLV